MNRVKSFEWGGAAFAVSPATIGSYMHTSRITAVLTDLRPEADPIARYYYPRLAAQTVIDGTVDGWTQPGVGDDYETIARSYDDWLQLSGNLAQLWINALVAVDTPTAEPELQPDFKDATDPKD